LEVTATTTTIRATATATATATTIRATTIRATATATTIRATATAIRATATATATIRATATATATTAIRVPVGQRHHVQVGEGGVVREEAVGDVHGDLAGDHQGSAVALREVRGVGSVVDERGREHDELAVGRVHAVERPSPAAEGDVLTQHAIDQVTGQHVYPPAREVDGPALQTHRERESVLNPSTSLLYSTLLCLQYL